MGRVNIKKILRDPEQKKCLIIKGIMLGQVEMGREADYKLAEQAYNNIKKEVNYGKNGVGRICK